MTHTHLIFVVLLLLLFSPSLLCSDAEARVFGGKEVAAFKGNLGIVSIYLSVNETKDGNTASVSRLCGGSAIKPFAILTSLYCMNLYESKEWKEGSGHNITVSFTNHRKLPYSVSFDNITVINHESFYDPEKNKTGSHKIIDMALVFLPKILTVQYPEISLTKWKLGRTLVAKGWGITQKSDTDFQTKLWNIKDASLAEFEKCDGNKPKYNEGYSKENYICVHSPGSGPCEGDYGGPVLAGSPEDMAQTGILIEPTKDYCGDGASPGDYFPVLRVDKFSSWIETNLKKYTVSSSGLIFFSPVLLGLSALVSLFLL